MNIEQRRLTKRLTDPHIGRTVGFLDQHDRFVSIEESKAIIKDVLAMPEAKRVAQCDTIQGTIQ